MKSPTPCPWINENGLVYGRESRTRFSGRPSRDIFDANEWPVELNEEARANAALISAAPDLLAALKEVSARWGTERIWDDRIIWEKAQSAIAKAESLI